MEDLEVGYAYPVAPPMMTGPHQPGGPRAPKHVKTALVCVTTSVGDWVSLSQLRTSQLL